MKADDNLARLLRVQAQTEAERGNLPILPMPGSLLASEPGEMEEAVRYIHWNVTALTAELMEALDETSWKPWTVGPPNINRDAFLGELIDVQHFLNNLYLVIGATSEEITDRYLEKSAINMQRFRGGMYDGRSTKCPNCGRALDDPYVTCSKLVGCTHDIESKGTATAWPAAWPAE